MRTLKTVLLVLCVILIVTAQCLVVVCTNGGAAQAKLCLPWAVGVTVILVPVFFAWMALEIKGY